MHQSRLIIHTVSAIMIYDNDLMIPVQTARQLLSVFLYSCLSDSVVQLLVLIVRLSPFR